MEFLWECVVLAIKVGVGVLTIVVGVVFFFLSIMVVSYGVTNKKSVFLIFNNYKIKK
jgi:hypothetical protein